MKKNIICLLFLVVFALSCDTSTVVYEYTEYSATKEWADHPTLTGVKFKGEYSFFMDNEKRAGKFECRYIWNGTLTETVTWNDIEFKANTVFENKVYREVVAEFTLSTLSFDRDVCVGTIVNNAFVTSTEYFEMPEGYDGYKTTYTRSESKTISSATDNVSNSEWKTVYSNGVAGMLLVSNTDDTGDIMNVFHLVYYGLDTEKNMFRFFNFFDSTTEPVINNPLGYNQYTKK